MALTQVTSGLISSVSNTAISGLITSAQIASVANTQITGVMTASQIATVANTQVTGLITSGQIASVANTQITGILGTSNGGTGQTTASAAFNALSPVTTTGDLIIGNGTNSSTRLGIGASTYVLTSNGTTATWAAPAASGPTKAQAIAYAMTLGF